MRKHKKTVRSLTGVISFEPEEVAENHLYNIQQHYRNYCKELEKHKEKILNNQQNKVKSYIIIKSLALLLCALEKVLQNTPCKNKCGNYYRMSFSVNTDVNIIIGCEKCDTISIVPLTFKEINKITYVNIDDMASEIFVNGIRNCVNKKEKLLMCMGAQHPSIKEENYFCDIFTMRDKFRLYFFCDVGIDTIRRNIQETATKLLAESKL